MLLIQAMRENSMTPEKVPVRLWRPLGGALVASAVAEIRGESDVSLRLDQVPPTPHYTSGALRVPRQLGDLVNFS